MATITGFTAARMLTIENDSIVSGVVTGDNLILTKRGGGTINAGNVRGATGSPGITAPELAAGLAGAATVAQMNTEISNRISGDATLTTNLNTEITNRTNADNAEAATRATYSKGLLARTTNATATSTTLSTGAAWADVPGATITFNTIAGRWYRLKVDLSGFFDTPITSPYPGSLAITDSVNNFFATKSIPIHRALDQFSADVEYVWQSVGTGGNSMKARYMIAAGTAGFRVAGLAPSSTVPWLVMSVYDEGV